MNSFTLVNPNKHLIRYGFILISIAITAFLLEKAGFAQDTMKVIIGIGFIVRILVIFWMPIAAQTVGRNTWFWTIFALIVTAPALILLGWLGYKDSLYLKSIVKDAEKEFQTKSAELVSMVEKQEISQNQMDAILIRLQNELSKTIQEKLSEKQDGNNKKLLNMELERQGYVLDNNSDVFVAFNGKCSACNTSVNENDETCPECGLSLK